MKFDLTDHVKEKLQRRKILNEELMDALHFPGKITKRHGKYFFQKDIGRGKIEACCEKTTKRLKVLTVYWV
ncbi:MAG: DUF4258 domain-containing protein [Candidatus Woesearchaeota archaeon]|jgi:hypothetical protein|nr:DUF4258 domain-containing protein [Candidatus Woesearchaeota archaeon]MDP7458238.1 DUF4258 domain-containing protein [Candidatus Woesearchaeota archaeon]|tara:strand:- start:340 stop:552 length:213 start_codon:yes stop_codon:yes gene_type:complete